MKTTIYELRYKLKGRIIRKPFFSAEFGYKTKNEAKKISLRKIADFYSCEIKDIQIISEKFRNTEIMSLM